MCLDWPYREYKAASKTERSNKLKPTIKNAEKNMECMMHREHRGGVVRSVRVVQRYEQQMFIETSITRGMKMEVGRQEQSHTRREHATSCSAAEARCVWNKVSVHRPDE